MLGSDSFLFVGCFSFVASESSFFVGQTFWSSLSFFVGMLTFGDLDDCRWGVLFPIFFSVLLGCLTTNEPELIDNLGCNRWF
ncbi:uncharacterized protein OCT59_008639 [Rhizophagus irregularis]|uniref:uncharacterized protein n=1 Tax=Rhizophagus irregularis TaxID=588596 RepID=UPI0019F54410|nr:hypothetical protein OCT59_023928 [Rhizophagus irregularis]UZO05187.1 hypothetical protein OCT59_025547 [Rhizophagus irregularis]UZO17280.1 hypothetical protein OCT59_008639 [Rhizophagus irregularis]GET51477.1 hypothetical protein GLOIN_2v1868960 [Rhizophagus irregularis DAOM 181602=DAOM 197198]